MLQDKSNKTFLQKSIIPISLVGVGAFINYSKGDFGKVHLQDQIQGGLNFNSGLDNFFLFIPAIEMYTANILQVKSANTLGDQTKYLLVANMTTFGVTQLLKHSLNEERPDKSNNQSFPSGHSAHAFVMATVLRNEYQDSNTLLAYSGYAFATTTALFRVLNNKHFVSDVFVGAGIGIAITELVYNFKPLKNWHPFNNKKNSVFISPMYQNDAVGIVGIMRF